ncbi:MULTISPECIES: O-antigen polymerase [Micromonospora]|uniref:Oligosaccharide repeat unit polymerase n=1 Tax=Micromonospora solifontis TaxID=2487138 RepID=A0ABX9WJE5_9ACTN|nr:MULTISPECIES: O-antigen polymerase [Micromonospora]NES15395.1 oligosaccharide repeat unit polymerase [Micromonospora sp. PPF5-17B]NES35859.1 oligosaccharide repeat unit polymerase [Micromonospora solifontis]NES57989.1 oligosaccharide repeat unit polymerase [Micromonospora sp. PPF5-6]RNM00332.1 oligosaccharide repeat unit polymerase [Micromonospora solifontis]
MLLFSLAVFASLALIVRSCAGHWFQPGAMFAGYWMIASALSAAFYGRETTYRALIYIAVGVAAFGLGSLVLTYTRPPFPGPVVRTSNSAPSARQGGLLWTIAAGTVSGLAAGFLSVRTNGISIDNLLSIEELLDASHQVAVGRYDNLLAASASGSQRWVSALLSITYCAALCAPFLALARVRFQRAWMLAPLASLVIYGFTTTARAGMVSGVFLWFSGYVAMRIMRDGRPPRITARAVAGTAGAMLAVTALFTFMAFLRIGTFDASTASMVRSRVAVYALGYQPAFSQWLEQREWADEKQLGLGTASVAGVSLLTGQSRRDFRTYDEFVVVDERGSKTNIYTMFRGVLIDFGRAGGVLVLFLFGAAAGAAYRAVMWHRSATAAAVLAGCYSIILWSSTISIIHYSNVLAAVVGAALVLNVALRPRPARHVRPTSRQFGAVAAGAGAMGHRR